MPRHKRSKLFYTSANKRRKRIISVEVNNSDEPIQVREEISCNLMEAYNIFANNDAEGVNQLQRLPKKTVQKV